MSENYHHLTYEERCQIEALQKRGHHDAKSWALEQGILRT